MNGRKKVIVNIKLITLIVLISGGAIGVTSFFDGMDAVVQGIDSMATLVISFLALSISIITFLSIDAVSQISAMEGNVLENPNYSMSSGQLIHEYKNIETQSDFSYLLFQKLDEQKILILVWNWLMQFRMYWIDWYGLYMWI